MCYKRTNIHILIRNYEFRIQNYSIFLQREAIFTRYYSQKNSESIPDGKALAKEIGSKKYYFLPPPKTKPIFTAY